MKNILGVLIISIFLGSFGVAWGVYETSKLYNIPLKKVVSDIDEMFFKPAPKVKPAPAPVIIAEPVKETAKVEDDYLFTAPKEALKVQAPDPKKMVKVEKTEPANDSATKKMIDEGNKYYDEGIQHYQKTLKRGSDFDRENDLAMKCFREALKKYLTVQEMTPDDTALQTKINETNQCLFQCRRQARRH